MSRELPEVCSIVTPPLFKALYDGIEKLPHDPIRLNLDNSAYELASICGYELIDGRWVKFPKRQEAINRVCKVYSPGGKGRMGRCEIVEEHGDGDLTVKTEDNVFVITTDGRVFREIQPLDR